MGTNIPSPPDLASYFAAIESHPFAALLIAIAVVAGIYAWRRAATDK